MAFCNAFYRQIFITVNFKHVGSIETIAVASRPRPDNERIMDVQEGRSSRLGVGRRAGPFCSYL